MDITKQVDVAHFMLTKPVVLQIASQYTKIIILKQGNETGAAAAGTGNATSTSTSSSPHLIQTQIQIPLQL